MDDASHQTSSKLAFEAQSLKAPSRAALLTTIVIGVSFSLCAYFFDGARVWAFGFMPAIVLSIIARDAGVSLKATPRLAILLWVAMLLVALMGACLGGAALPARH